MTKTTIPRRPRQDYYELGFKAGDIVTFQELPNEEVRVEDGKHLARQGRIVSMTVLLKSLGKQLGMSKYTGSVKIDGHDFTKRYDKIHGPKHSR